MCDCKVGPGKFEGESALAFLAYEASLNGFADEYTGLGECDTAVTWFRSPFGFDADSIEIDRAREYGYCDECIQEALESKAYGLSLYKSDQGFVYLEEYDTREEFDKALAEAEAEDAADAESDDEP